MKITMTYSGGTARGFLLASEFEKRECLDRLFIPYYSSKYPLLTKLFGRPSDKYDLGKEHVYTNLPYCLLRKLLWHSQKIRRSPYRAVDRYFLSRLLDNWTEKRLNEEADIVLAESHIALKTITTAKKMGMVTFLDRQASNVEFQVKILKEEFQKYGLDYQHDQRDIERGLQEYRDTDYIIVPSAFVKETFKFSGIAEEKIITVAPGINLQHFQRSNIKTDDVFRIIYCGGIYLTKGIHYLLEAFSNLKLKKAELWLIGPVGNEVRDILKRYEGNYKLIGFVPNYRLSEYYSRGSVFILPSLQDSFGKVVVEAMSCGLPAIVSENTGVKDSIHEAVNGFVVPVRDAEALKEKILYLYENKDICREMGENAMNMVASDSSLEAYAERIISVFGKSLNEKNS